MIYTCDLLLWQSHRLGTRDYETLSQAIGGKWYRIFTEVRHGNYHGEDIAEALLTRILVQ